MALELFPQHAREHQEIGTVLCLEHPAIAPIREEAALPDRLLGDDMDEAGRPLVLLAETAQCQSDTLAGVNTGFCFDDHVVDSCIAQLCAGVLHLHRHGIVHRRIEPKNILLERDEFPGRVALQITGWGLAASDKQVDGDGDGADSFLDACQLLPSRIKTARPVVVGVDDGCYQSPELLEGSSLCTDSYLWSICLVIFVVMFGRQMWNAASF